MKSVFQTTNGPEAHVVAGLLRQAGLEAQVWGENVGAYAHPLGSVQVAVPGEQEDEARRVLADYEGQQAEPGAAGPDTNAQTPAEREPPARSPLRTAGLLAAGAALVAVIWYLIRIL